MLVTGQQQGLQSRADPHQSEALVMRVMMAAVVRLVTQVTTLSLLAMVKVRDAQTKL